MDKPMGRYAASIQIVKASWAVLRQDKELLWLPVFSLLSTAVTIALFVGGFLATSRTAGLDGTQQLHPGPLGYVLLFAMYLVLATITVFFNAALVSAAHQRFTGGDPTLNSALGGATQRFGVLLPWALVSATVSTVLRAIQDRAGLLGRIIAGLVGMAWALVTFLVLPIIVVEGLSVGDAIRRSKELFKRTWGEQVVGNLAIGVVSVLAVVAAAPVALLMIATDSTVLMAVGVVGWLVWAAVVMAVYAALSGVFQTALYLYASTGTIPAGFPPAAVEAAFRPKRKDTAFRFTAR